MATENNIAITAICETIEDIQRGIQTLDARLSALEEELGTETDGPIDMYQIEAGDLQVSLQEPVFDFRLPPEHPIEETQPDPARPYNYTRKHRKRQAGPGHGYAVGFVPKGNPAASQLQETGRYIK